jgi:predicted metal-dependent hydrolase
LIFKNKIKILDEIEFPKQIEISGKIYGIEVIFSQKKSSSVSIKKDKLIFRLSSYLSKKLAQQHFSDLLKRIYSKIEKSDNRKKEFTIEDVLEKQQFKFSQEKYQIELTNKVRGVKLIENTFYINYKTRKELVEKHILKHFLERYSQRLIEYINNLNQRTYNYKIKEISLKLVNSKWGHCTYDNKIMLNLKLLNAPIEVLDYVILHEIAHIKHKNHSASYWKEVSRYCPNYKELRKELKNNSPNLFEEL